MKKSRLVMMFLALMVTMTSWAQEIVGTVIDDQGETVIGASVVEKVILRMVLLPTLMVTSPLRLTRALLS